MTTHKLNISNEAEEKNSTLSSSVEQSWTKDWTGNKKSTFVTLGGQ